MSSTSTNARIKDRSRDAIGDCHRGSYTGNKLHPPQKPLSVLLPLVEAFSAALGTLKVVALVELDDRMHDSQADRQRDIITKAAGYQTIRYQSRQKPPEAEIAALFQHARAWTNP